MSFTITRSRKHHVSMGNYEWTEFGAEVTFDSADYEDGTTPEQLGAEADSVLEAILKDEIVVAFDNTDEKTNTYIQFHDANTSRRTRKSR